MNSDEILDNLIKIYFKKSGYLRNASILTEEFVFINKRILVKPLFKNGYDTEKQYQRELMEDKWYELNNMNVGRSHSEIEVKEIPTKWFNAVSFEYKIEEL